MEVMCAALLMAGYGLWWLMWGGEKPERQRWLPVVMVGGVVLGTGLLLWLSR